MSQLPDFSCYGYRIERSLGQNLAGGRITYLATHLTTQQRVVIKQFQFAKTGTSWTDYDAYDREIQTLQGLDHPGIPHYLESFQTEDGFCMVQDYKQATPLAIARSFAPFEIQKIAVALLEILVYLQSRLPPVIHRDIKPDNILVDEQLNVYLVDFGFARLGGGEVGVSSVVKGTLGFMPPEQLFNRQLTTASDLYGLGITLICLITGTQSTEVGNLIDITYRINFKPLAPKLSVRWVQWLEKMVEPRLTERFPNAVAALVALPDDLILPEVILSQATLKFTASCLNETLTQSLQIHNPAAQTLLTGTWEVAPHPSDPSSTAKSHPWISINPPSFSSNATECQITVDTRPLMANKGYTRELRLHTNALPKTYSLTLHIQTAPIPVRLQQLPYGDLLLLFPGAIALSWVMSWVVLVVGSLSNMAIAAGFGALVGISLGFELAAWMLSTAGASMAATTAVVAGAGTGILTLLMVALTATAAFGALPTLTLSMGIGLISGLIGGAAIGMVGERLAQKRLPKKLALTLPLLTAATGASLGVGLTLGFGQGLVILGLLGAGMPLTATLIHLRLQRSRLILDHRRTESHLIKP